MSETKISAHRDAGFSGEKSWAQLEREDATGKLIRLAELRAKVTEAEAAYGRAVFDADARAMASCSAPNGFYPSTRGVNEAREALRQAEEAERKPRLASSGDICERAMANPEAMQITGNLSKEIISVTRADMLTKIRKLTTHTAVVGFDVGPVRAGPLIHNVPAVLLADIEALVREAGE